MTNDRLIYYISQFLSKGFQLIIVLVYSKFLPPETLGQFYIILMTSTILGYFCSGNSSSTIRHFCLKSEIDLKYIHTYLYAFVIVYIAITSFLFAWNILKSWYIYLPILYALSNYTENFLLGNKKYVQVVILNLLKIFLEIIIFVIVFRLVFSMNYFKELSRSFLNFFTIVIFWVIP